MMRDLNPSSKSHSKPQHFIGEQPRKACDKSSKFFSKKTHAFHPSHDVSELDRERHNHSYHRASSKNIAREFLRAGQY